VLVNLLSHLLVSVLGRLVRAKHVQLVSVLAKLARAKRVSVRRRRVKEQM